MTASLPDADWLHRPGLDTLLDALGADEGQARFVGGAVRDTLLGLPVADVDIATIHDPHEVIRRLKAADIKTVPTGIDHGTITAVLSRWPVEITTLRRDIDTNGRHATIAFTDDWREDAARRDFTINALFADPRARAISDYFGGLEDLHAGVVRFIGEPEARIAEDHLRILRYFRFFARFGKGVPDPQAYAACKACANSLMALSRERIADELLKLLALPNPASAVGLMVAGGILLPVLPEITEDGVVRLAALITRETRANIAPASLRRLAALLPRDAAVGDDVTARLKLSNRARKRVGTALARDPGDNDPLKLAYWIGMEGAVDRLLLDEAVPEPLIASVTGLNVPSFGLSGGALISRGLTPGPDVARALREVEQAWVERSFPEGEALDAIADQIVWKFQRARQ